MNLIPISSYWKHGTPALEGCTALGLPQHVLLLLWLILCVSHTAAGAADFGSVAQALKKEQSHHPEGEGNCLGFASLDSQGVLVPHKFKRREGR